MRGVGGFGRYKQVQRGNKKGSILWDCVYRTLHAPGNDTFFRLKLFSTDVLTRKQCLGAPGPT